MISLLDNDGLSLLSLWLKGRVGQIQSISLLSQSAKKIWAPPEKLEDGHLFMDKWYMYNTAEQGAYKVWALEIFSERE